MEKALHGTMCLALVKPYSKLWNANRLLFASLFRYGGSCTTSINKSNPPTIIYLRSKVVKLDESSIAELLVHVLQLWMVEHLVCGSYEDRSKV